MAVSAGAMLEDIVTKGNWSQTLLRERRRRVMLFHRGEHFAQDSDAFTGAIGFVALHGLVKRGPKFLNLGCIGILHE
jgi:hypothetical protein